MDETFRRVISVLNSVGAKWSVVGAHAVNSYVRPRATVDVDIVVDARRFRSVVDGLRAEFGEIETEDIGAALRITTLSVDLIRSDNHVLFRAALDLAQKHGDVWIPPPELLMVLKFMAAVSPWRNVADRKQDAADLIRLYQALGSDFDRDAAVGHAKLAYSGAEREFSAMLDRLDRGEDIAL